MTSGSNNLLTDNKGPAESGQHTNKIIATPKKLKNIKKPENEIPRGQPKSNRPWKTPKAK